MGVMHEHVKFRMRLQDFTDHSQHNRLHPTHVVSHAPCERHEDGREDGGLCDLYTARPQE